MIGKVIEVFIPEQYKNGSLLDIMDRTLIGFRVETEEGIKEIIHDQNEENVEIRREDTVFVKEKVIVGNTYMEIEKVEEYE